MAVEIELKLRLDPNDTQTISQALNNIAQRQPVRPLNNVYYDTLDAELATHRCALRIRQQGAHFEQTLKTVGQSQAGLQQRNEWNWPLNHNQLDPTRLQLADVQAHWPAEIAIDQLTPHFATHFERQVWHWQEGNNAIEIVLDQGTIEHAGKQQTLCELELELLSGAIEPLWTLAHQLANHCPLWLSDISKAERGYQLANHRVSWPPLVNPSDQIDATANQCLRVLQRVYEYTLWYQQTVELDVINALETRLLSLIDDQQIHPALQHLCQALQAHRSNTLHTLRQQTRLGQALLAVSRAVYRQASIASTESTSALCDV